MADEGVSHYDVPDYVRTAPIEWLLDEREMVRGNQETIEARKPINWTAHGAGQRVLAVLDREIARKW